MSQPFIGPLTDPQLPAQPGFQAFCLNWDAFDVPRLWDIVRLEDDEFGWEQVTGFRHLSDLLVDHYRRLRTQYAALAQAWQSPAAEVVLARVGAYANAILSDGHCAAATANALHTIMTTYADARLKMAPLFSEWNNVTSDWKPEWWDHAAYKLNNEAREIMVKTDVVVRDHRTSIIIPSLMSAGGFDQSTSLIPPLSSDGSGADAPTGRVPPVPGHMPLSSADSGVGLASLPKPVPAVPGQPVSMLPVPPGSNYAPFGGAYILPGPGVGRGGYIVPMPHPIFGPSGRGSVYSPVNSPTGRPAASSYWQPGAGNGLGGTGIVPMGFGTMQPAGGVSASSGRKGFPNTTWEIERGVTPVIEGIGRDEFIPDQPSEQQEEEFKEWFAELAYPWRSDRPNGSTPHIILRKTDT